MCGIAGGVFRTVPPTARLERVLASLTHRGPDDQGQHVVATDYGTLLFAHTRLSIIDLSSGGHQPMHSPDGRYTLLYNGEVYNYRELREELHALGHAFRTDSDTEVLLAAWTRWGTETLARLRGMFAFAVHDAQERTITCVRDAFGIKPFFWTAGADGFAFASEKAALIELLGRTPPLDLQRAYDYLVESEYDNVECTFHDGIKHLRPGHMLVYDLAGQVVNAPRRWWWPAVEARTDLSFADAAERFRAMFLDNVRLHLRSDVPVGAALSGGLDSAAIVCAMRHLEPDLPLHTFTYVSQGGATNEEPWADLVNRHVGAAAHKVTVSADELAADLDDLIRYQGEPFGSTSIYAQYRVFRAARDAGIKVMLEGQGADEALAGYEGYPEQRLHSLLEGGQVVAALRFIQGWGKWPGRSRRRFATVAAMKVAPVGLLKRVPTPLKARLREWFGVTAPPSYLRSEVLDTAGVRRSYLPPARDGSAHRRRLAAKLRRQLTEASMPHLLRHGDRNSMRWSIESRVPFLTTDLAEFTLRLPEEYLLSPSGETKRLLRAGLRGIVPDAVLDRRDKVGFETPERDWLRALGPRTEAWLEGLDGLPFIDASAARAEVTGIINGDRPFSWLAWRLINLARWAQLHA